MDKGLLEKEALDFFPHPLPSEPSVGSHKLEERIGSLEERVEALELVLRRASLMVARHVEEHRDLTSR